MQRCLDILGRYRNSSSADRSEVLVFGQSFVLNKNEITQLLGVVAMGLNMKNLIFLFAGSVIVLVSYFLGSGKIDFSGRGKYNLSSSADPNFVWRINSDTGQLSACVRLDFSKPLCSLWSDNNAK